MLEEPIGGAGGATGADTGGSDSGSGGGSDISSLSDSDAISQALEGPSGTEPQTTETVETTDAAAKETPAETEVNLAALEEGQPDWLAKVTDPAVKSEVEKLLAMQSKFAGLFKDDADFETFKTEYPGGREQIAAERVLSNQVTQQDATIAANTPEGNATIAGQYLTAAPDGGAGLFRAAAAHLSKTQPEAWANIGSELVNSTLKASGIGVDLPTLTGTLNEIRSAIQADDQTAFGNAVSKLLGKPAQEKQGDPRIEKAQEAERTARAAERTAKVQVWENSVGKAIETSQNHVRQSVGTALSAKDSQGRPLIPASIPAKQREELAERIFKEVDSQMGADGWLMSQIFNLVGSRNGDKQNLAADKTHFDKATELSKQAANRILPSVVRKQVSEWARALAASSREAIDKAKGNPTTQRREPSGSTPQSKGNRRLSTDDIVGPNAKDDKQILESVLGL